MAMRPDMPSIRVSRRGKILIGIVVGTYSSIFIASPIVLWWSGRRGMSLKSEVTKPASASPIAKA